MTGYGAFKHSRAVLRMSCVDGSRVARLNRRISALVRYSRVSGLFVQSVRKLLAMMESVSSVPLAFAGYDASDIRRGVPAPGLTGSPSHLFVLATSFG
jgi:hypothetical protein